MKHFNYHKTKFKYLQLVDFGGWTNVSKLKIPLKSMDILTAFHLENQSCQLYKQKSECRSCSFLEIQDDGLTYFFL